jgi:hypothetical protein
MAEVKCIEKESKECWMVCFAVLNPHEAKQSLRKEIKSHTAIEVVNITGHKRNNTRKRRFHTESFIANIDKAINSSFQCSNSTQIWKAKGRTDHLLSTAVVSGNRKEEDRKELR